MAEEQSDEQMRQAISEYRAELERVNNLARRLKAAYEENPSSSLTRLLLKQLTNEEAYVVLDERGVHAEFE